MRLKDMVKIPSFKTVDQAHKEVHLEQAKAIHKLAVNFKMLHNRLLKIEEALEIQTKTIPENRH